MRISDGSSDVCSSDLLCLEKRPQPIDCTRYWQRAAVNLGTEGIEFAQTFVALERQAVGDVLAQAGQRVEQQGLEIVGNQAGIELLLLRLRQFPAPFACGQLLVLEIGLPIGILRVQRPQGGALFVATQGSSEVRRVGNGSVSA